MRGINGHRQNRFMTNRVYFDQRLIQKDFASFREDELFTIKSFFRRIVDGFSGNSSSWDAAFKFASNDSGDMSALIVAGHCYLLSLSLNRIVQYKRVNASSVTFRDVSVVGLNKNKVLFWDKRLNLIQEKTLKWNCDLIFSIGDKLLAMGKGSLIDVEENKKILGSIPAWSRYCVSRDSIVLIDKMSINVIRMNGNREFAVINVDGNNKCVLDCAFSGDGERFYVLYCDNEVSVLSCDNVFSRIETFEVVGATSICSWGQKHIVTANGFGSLIFVALGTHETQHHSVRPLSVLKGTPDGFVLFEPQSEVGANNHFDVSHFVSVTPFELYRRNCEQGFFGDALVLIRTFNFEEDIYHKAYIEQSDMSINELTETLGRIKDREWVYEFCKRAPVASADVVIKLVQIGLDVKPEDHELLRARERLRSFRRICKDEFQREEWKKFRSCDLEQEMTVWAKKSLFVRLGVVLRDTTELDHDAKRRILANISPFAKPSAYRDVMPSDIEWFKYRAIVIDNVTGQPSIVVDLMKNGMRRMPALKVIYDIAVEFRRYVLRVADADTFAQAKFETYVEMNDDERLMLFAMNISGRRFAHELKSEAGTIVERSPGSLAFVLSDALINDTPRVFSRYSFVERISEIVAVLKKIPENDAKSFVNGVMDRIPTVLTPEIVSSLFSSLQVYMNDVNEIVMGLFKYIPLSLFHGTFKDLRDTVSIEFVTRIARSVISEKKETWKEFRLFATKINDVIFNQSSFSGTIKELEIEALVALREFDEIEVETERQRDIVVRMVKLLCERAASVSLTDEYLAAALSTLGRIPGDMMNVETKDLFNKFAMYRCISEIDPNMTPRDVNASADATTLVVQIITGKEHPYDIEAFYGTIVNALKLMDNVCMIVVNGAFAKVCVRDGHLDTGQRFVEDADDDVILEYITRKDFDDAVRLCNMCIRRCSKELLPGFIDWKGSHCADTETISILARVNNERLFRHGFERIAVNSRKHEIDVFCESQVVNGQLRSFLEMILKMKNYGLIDQVEYDSYQTLAWEKVDSTGLAARYEVLRRADKNGMEVGDENKCEIFTRGYLDQFGLSLSNTFSVDGALALMDDNKTKIKGSDVVELLRCWKATGDLTLERVERVALMTIVSDFCKNREFWADVMDESGELKVFEATQNYEFALTSNFASVVEMSVKLLKKERKLTCSVVNLIIDRKRVHYFVETDHFKDIIGRVRSKIQARLVFEDLEAHSERDAAIDILLSFFQIPRQFANIRDAQHVIDFGKTLLEVDI